MKRKEKINRRRASGSRAPEREPFEGARAFGVSLSRRLCFPSGRAPSPPSRASRALAFARKITARHARQPGARTLDFLRSYFGGKYEVVESQGLTGTKIYKKPGGSILESTYKLSVNITLLLNLARSVEALHLRLMRNSLTLLQHFTELTKLPGKDASPMRLLSGHTSLVKLLSERTHAQAQASAPPLVSMLRLTSMPALVPAPVLHRQESTEFVQRDSITRREVRERVRATASSARVSNLITAQGTTGAEKGDKRTLPPAATKAHHFNFALFNQSFRQTRLYPQSHFGRKYEVIEGQSLTGAVKHSKPGERIQERLRESTYKLSVNFTLLLNLTRSVETLHLRLMRNSLTLLQSFAELTKLPSERARLINLLSTRAHAQSPAAAPPVLIPRSTEFVRRDSFARREVRERAKATGSFERVSSLLATHEASIINAHTSRITSSSAEAERDSLTALYSVAMQVSHINSALSRQNLIFAPGREMVYSNFAQTHLRHYFRQGGNLQTALALDAQSHLPGRVLIRQQNFLRSLSAQAASLTHDFKQTPQTPAGLFISEAHAMSFADAAAQPLVLRGTASLTLPYRQALTPRATRGPHRREVLQRGESLCQSEFANVWNITARNDLSFMPGGGGRLAHLTIAREAMPVAVGRSFIRPTVHEKLAREKVMLEAFALKTRTTERLTVKMRAPFPAAQFVTNGMRNMVTANLAARSAGAGMVSAQAGVAINARALVNVRRWPAAAAKREPVSSTLNLARGAMSVAGVGPMPAPLGKVDTLRLPPLGYVYAQPVRSTLEEQRVVTQVDHKEVTRIVQREVQSAMARDAGLTRFSSADYAQIADQVYSTLVRRLIVERERLGLC